MIWKVAAVASVFCCILLKLYIGALKRQLCGMKQELVRTRDFSYNKQITVSLFDRDLTELATEINRNLDYQKQLKLQTQQSELALRQSVSDIAHDLRTPLTVIKGNLQMLGGEGLSDKGRERFLACQNKVRELGEMVDDFFEMSVLESDSKEAVLEKVNFTKLLMQFVIDHEVFIREHDLTPDIRMPEKNVFIKAEERLLIRMLENLLGNVVKYAKESFRLDMEVLPDGKCRVTFSNAAEELLLEDTAQLFRRTYRGNRARSGKGAGLGLYIVKLLAEKQGAEAQARQADGQLFISVSFPMAEEE